MGGSMRCLIKATATVRPPNQHCKHDTDTEPRRSNFSRNSDSSSFAGQVRTLGGPGGEGWLPRLSWQDLGQNVPPNRNPTTVLLNKLYRPGSVGSC